MCDRMHKLPQFSPRKGSRLPGPTSSNLLRPSSRCPHLAMHFSCIAIAAASCVRCCSVSFRWPTTPLQKLSGTSKRRPDSRLVPCGGKDGVSNGIRQSLLQATRAASRSGGERAPFGVRTSSGMISSGLMMHQCFMAPM